MSFTGVPTGPLTAPLDQSFTAVVSPPADAVPGTYKVDVKVSADGVSRTSQPLTITVKTPLSGLTVSATPANVGAGIDEVKLTDIPNAWLGFYAGSTPVGSTRSGRHPWARLRWLDTGGIHAGRIDSRGLDSRWLDSRGLDPRGIDTRGLDGAVRHAGRVDTGWLDTGGVDRRALVDSFVSDRAGRHLVGSDPVWNPPGKAPRGAHARGSPNQH